MTGGAPCGTHEVAMACGENHAGQLRTSGGSNLTQVMPVPSFILSTGGQDCGGQAPAALQWRLLGENRLEKPRSSLRCLLSLLENSIWNWLPSLFYGSAVHFQRLLGYHLQHFQATVFCPLLKFTIAGCFAADNSS